MDQMKFIFMSKKVEPESVTDDGNGKVIVNLRKGVELTHDYKKGNRMEIHFEGDRWYEIPSENELEILYRMHLANTNFIQPAIKYCDDNLNTV